MTDTIDLADLELEFRVIGFGLQTGTLPSSLSAGHFKGERSRYLASKISLLGDACSKGLILHGLKREGRFEDVPAFEALIDRLIVDPVSPEEARAASVHLRELATGRELADLLSGSNGVASALKGQRVGDALRMLESFVLGNVESEGVIAEASAGQDRVRVMTELARRKSIDGFPGFQTFIDPLDDAIGGLLPGEFGLIAGGTGQGKSLSLLDIAARNWEHAGRNCAYITIELGILQQEFRLASWGTGIEIDKFRWGTTTDEEDARVEVFFREREARPNHLYFVDVPANVNAAFIDRKMSEVERERGIRFDLVFVDYLGLMTAIGGGFSSRTTWDSLAEVSWNLHNLARRRDIGLWSAVQKKENISEAERRRGGIASIGLSYLIAQPTDITIVLTEKTLEGFLEANIAKGRDTGASRIKLRPDLRRARIHSEV